MMAGEKERYKKALERYAKHLQEIRNITSVIPKGTDAERASRMARAREDYDFFVHAYFPHLATSRCGKFQIEAAEYIKNNPRARCVFEWARGHAKSSHISLMIPLWLKIQENPEPMIMVLVSKSADMARRLLSDLQAELEGNDLFLHDFGRQKTDGLWTDGEFVCADGSMFIALGRGQSPRGIKRRGLRVNYISIDDIDDDEMCRNPRRVDEAVDWCLSALIGTMAMGRGRFVLVGNRIGQYSILGEMAARPHFYHTVVNALDKKGKPSWWQNYQLSEINDLRVEVGERRFQKEYMNNPLDEGSVFERKYIRYGKMLPLREYRAIVSYTDPVVQIVVEKRLQGHAFGGADQRGEVPCHKGLRRPDEGVSHGGVALRDKRLCGGYARPVLHGVQFHSGLVDGRVPQSGYRLGKADPHYRGRTEETGEIRTHRGVAALFPTRGDSFQRGGKIVGRHESARRPAADVPAGKQGARRCARRPRRGRVVAEQQSKDSEYPLRRRTQT